MYSDEEFEKTLCERGLKVDVRSEREKLICYLSQDICDFDDFDDMVDFVSKECGEK